MTAEALLSGPVPAPLPTGFVRRRGRMAALLVGCGVVVQACAAPSAQEARSDGGSGEALEVRPRFLRLPDALSPRETMISGLAWAGDDLILLPQQRPVAGRRSAHRGKLYSIPRHAIEAGIDALDDEPLVVDEWTLEAPGLDTLDGFEGLEALTISGDTVFMTVESNTPPGPRSWLLRGRLDAARRTVRMDPAEAVIMGRSGILNLAEEALVMYGGEVISLHEANGSSANPGAVAHAFPVAFEPGAPWVPRTLPMSPLEYRVTDATDADGTGRFWVANFFFQGDVELDGPDELFGGPPPGSRSAAVPWIERLVELRVTPDGIVPGGHPPLYIEPGTESRNWEGIARLGSRGLLIVVDKFPSSLLAFVPYPVR